MTQPVIVVVDNDLPFLELLHDLLTEEGFRVIPHAERHGAATLSRQQQPDPVILDIRLEHPEAGWEVLDLIRLAPGTVQIPVIICFADSNLHKKAAVLQDQRCELLENRFDLDRLVSTVNTALDAIRRNPEAHRDEPAG